MRDPDPDPAEARTLDDPPFFGEPIRSHEVRTRACTHCSGGYCRDGLDRREECSYCDGTGEVWPRHRT